MTTPSDPSSPASRALEAEERIRALEAELAIVRGELKDKNETIAFKNRQLTVLREQLREVRQLWGRMRARLTSTTEDLERLLNSRQSKLGKLFRSSRMAKAEEHVLKELGRCATADVKKIPQPIDDRMQSTERPPVTVVVPVYNALEQTVACIESLLRHQSDANYEILLIDDASPDERVWPRIQELAENHQCITALRNPKNLGYTRTINRGCCVSTGDVVLLNSDTLVTRGWIRKLGECAYSVPDIGTVTPVSNAAGAFSVPINNSINSIPEGFTVEEMGVLVEKLSGRIWPEVPTGNGFCLFIKRKVLDAIGGFDAENFPRGYGEENDFCMRAIEQGFSNRIDDSTFIYHERSASFGDEKKVIIEESLRTLYRLHPTYREKVAAWLKNDPLDGFRETLSQAIKREGVSASSRS